MTVLNFLLSLFSCHKHKPEEPTEELKPRKKRRVSHRITSCLNCSAPPIELNTNLTTPVNEIVEFRQFPAFERLKNRKSIYTNIKLTGYKYLEAVYDNQSLSTLDEEEEPDELPVLTNDDLAGFNKNSRQKELVVRVMDLNEFMKSGLLVIDPKLVDMVAEKYISFSANGQMTCSVREEDEKKDTGKLRRWRSSESLNYAGYESEFDIFKTPTLFDTTAESAEDSD